MKVSAQGKSMHGVNARVKRRKKKRRKGEEKKRWRGSFKSAPSFRPFWCLRSSLVRLVACRSPSLRPLLSATRQLRLSCSLTHLESHTMTRAHARCMHTGAREGTPLSVSILSPYSFPPPLRPLRSFSNPSPPLPSFQSVLLARPPPLAAPSFLPSRCVSCARAPPRSHGHVRAYAAVCTHVDRKPSHWRVYIRVHAYTRAVLARFVLR